MIYTFVFEEESNVPDDVIEGVDLNEVFVRDKTGNVIFVLTSNL